MLFQFAQAFTAAQADSFHRILEGNVPLLNEDNGLDGITASTVRDRWNKGIGHFSGVCFLKDDFSLACEMDV
jgi:hypothetical protein